MRLEPARLVVRDPLGLWQRASSTRGAIARARRAAARRPGPLGRARVRAARPVARLGQRERRRLPARWPARSSRSTGCAPYREGSPASRIHWPAVARTGEMIERRLVAGGEPRPLVVFDPHGATDPTQRERAMRAAASLCVELARSGGCDLLLPGERRPFTIDPSLRSWPEAHVRIAVIRSRRGPAAPPAPERLGRPLGDRRAGRCPAPCAGLRAGSFLITPSGSRRGRAFRVSGCFGYPVAGLAERRATRRRAAA